MKKPSRRRAVAAVAGAAVLAAVIVVGLVIGARQDPPEVATLDGPPVPALSGEDPVTGARVAVADFSGRPLVINMWASWCPGCQVEAPDIKRFTEDHPEVGLLGIDVTDARAGAREFVARYEWTHPSIFDPTGRLSARLGLRGLPTTVFVGPDGRIAGEVVGEVTYEQLVAATEGMGSPR